MLFVNFFFLTHRFNRHLESVSVPKCSIKQQNWTIISFEIRWCETLNGAKKNCFYFTLKKLYLPL